MIIDDGLFTTMQTIATCHCISVHAVLDPGPVLVGVGGRVYRSLLISFPQNVARPGARRRADSIVTRHL